MNGEKMTHTITLVYGDGIGPEVVRSAIDILEAANLRINWRECALGLSALEKYGQAVPKETLACIKETKVALKGPTTTPIGSGHKSANVELRVKLDLFACIRPIKSLPGLKTRFSDVDIVVIRENTEGLYCGQEIQVQPNCVISLRTMTEKGCSRIIDAAFLYAKKHGRRKVCVAHKANILKLGDGLWLKCAHQIRQAYQDIDYEESIVDALAMKMVMAPEKFDVIVLENMFGDIISDLGCGLVGGLGLVPGANLSENYAVFEAVHGSAPDIAGKDIANPCAMIQSAIMMLDYLGESEAALRIEKALLSVLEKEALRTRDLGGQASTSQFTKHVVNELRNL
jgi:isocitrate dehydrogenase (NAD+)